MAAPASPLQQLHRPTPLPRASSPRSDLDDFGRYQFQVVAANITDAVMSIGGLIFDRAMAGWDVSVVVDGSTDRVIDDRPIRILGGRVAERLDEPCRAAGPPAPACGRDGRDGQKRSRPPAGACRRQRQRGRRAALGPAPPDQSELHGSSPPGTGRVRLPRCSNRRPWPPAAPWSASRPTRASTRWPDRQPGLPAVTNCNVRWVCCSMSTRPDDVNRSTNSCRSNKRSPIIRALAVIACRTRGIWPA